MYKIKTYQQSILYHQQTEQVTKKLNKAKSL